MDGAPLPLRAAKRHDDKRATFAACLISAAGSLPLHMMALIVALAISEGEISIAHAGWISSSFMAGLLIGSVGLPMAGATRVSARASAGVTAMLIVALWAGATLGGPFLFAGWVTIGTGCSVLNLLGSTYAAARNDRRMVLGLRLALVLLASAALIAATDLLTGFGSYRSTVAVLGAAFAVFALVGVPFYKPPVDTPILAPRARSTGRVRFGGAAVVVLFFLGQPGFNAYSAYIAAANGIDSTTLPIAFAVCKAVAALALMRWSLRPKQDSAPTLLLAFLLAAAIAMMAFSTFLASFVAGLLLWEIAVNLQSTRLQATFLAGNPRFAGPWLPALIAVGAGLGPAIHGWAIAEGAGLAFVALSASTAFLPVLWVVCTKNRHDSKRSGSGPLSPGLDSRSPYERKEAQ